MNTETKKILATLDVLLESCRCITLPGHEDGGDIYPFVWDKSKQGEFNPFNVSLSKKWLKQTDNDIERTTSQGIEYTKSFISYSLSVEEERKKLETIQELFQLLNNNLQELQTFEIITHFASGSIHLVIGQTVDGDWISVCPTVYTESYIPQEQISRTFQKPALVIEGLGENTKELVSKIKITTSKIGRIEVQSDIADYSMAYSYRMLYATGKTKESAIEKVLQASRILEIGHFDSFYSDVEYFEEEFVDEPEEAELIYQRYSQINEFLNQTFSKVMMYRFSFWTLENIYIIGETSSSDWVGIHIESDFVYNP